LTRSLSFANVIIKRTACENFLLRNAEITREGKPKELQKVEQRREGFSEPRTAKFRESNNQFDRNQLNSFTRKQTQGQETNASHWNQDRYIGVFSIGMFHTVLWRNGQDRETWKQNCFRKILGPK
jgi:hypothetical protein